MYSNISVDLNKKERVQVKNEVIREEESRLEDFTLNKTANFVLPG